MAIGTGLLVGAATLPACAEHAGNPPPSQAVDAAASSEAGDAGADVPEASVDAARSLDAGSDISLEQLDSARPDAPVSSDADVRPLDTGVEPAAARTSLVLPELWTELGLADDPFDDRPPTPSCAAQAVMPETLSEERVLSIDTGSCDYFSAMQTTRRDVAIGEVLKVRLWHFELSAPEAAEAHAALLVDGLAVLDERVPIPQPGALMVRQLRAERAIPAGAPVYFHLHNHGTNSWSLVEVSAGP
jgi:hypothetical protein